MTTKSHSTKLGARIWKIELGVFLRVCESVDTPRSLACYLMARHECWSQYLELPFPDTMSPTFSDDYLCSEAMRKNPRLPGLDIDREAVAMVKWLEAEDACRLTNSKLLSYTQGQNCFDPVVEGVLTKARSWIAEVLGPLSTRKLEFAEENFRFGPGATSSCSGRDVVLSRKMVSRLDVTPGLYPYCRTLVRGPWRDYVPEVSLRHYNTVRFVPKDSKTDRAISIEPHVNIFVQLGIGALLRQRLKWHGLDLDHQADKNRMLASVAHITGKATIDLSSASDTISRELVWLLLPVEWAYLLDTARTGWSKLGDKMYKLEKFSAMGNGYTFELESLIFTALSRACGDPDAVSFGDDIIIDSSCAVTLMPTLNQLGFKVNERKTFLAGRFFESCGADYLLGNNVRPFFLRGEYHDLTSAVIRIGNKIRTYAHRRNLSLGCDVRFLPAWLFCISRDSTARKTGIPLDSGDDGLIRNFDEARPSKARHGLCGYTGYVWRTRPRRSERTSIEGAYLSALHKGTPGKSSIEPRRTLVNSPTPCDLAPSGDFDQQNVVGDDRSAVTYAFRTHHVSRLKEDVRGSFAGAALGRQLVMSWPEPGPWY